jgi:hypothetical protein
MSSILPDPFRSRRYGVKSFGQKSRKSRFADPEGDFGQSSTRPSLPQWIRRGALVVLLLGVGGLLGFLIRPGKASAVATFTTETPSARPAASSAPVLPQGEPAAATWQGPRPVEVARAFTAATTPAERLQWVDQPEEVAALLEEFYTHGPGSTETITGLTAMRLPLQEGQAVQAFMVTMADGTFRRLDVAYELDGHARVDFKSYSRHCSTPWSALLDGSCPSAAEMRVRLRVDSYYNRDFSDESTWLCLIATSPDLKEPLYLYARRDNPNLKDLLRDPPALELRYTVSIQNTEAGWQHRQFILSKVLRSGWLGR